MLALRSVSAAGRRCKPTALLARATTTRISPLATTLPRYQFSSIRSRGMAQVPVGQPTKPLPDKRSIIPLEHPDPSIVLTNIQGDVYPTFPKKVEQFIFFSITNPDGFREKLREFRKCITTAADVVKHLKEIEEARKKNQGLPKPLPKDRMVKLTQYQIGFSFSGMTDLHIESPGDPELMDGQKKGAADLGDEPAPESTSAKFVGEHWSQEWREKKIDGVILAASESSDTCEEAVAKAIGIFGNSIKVEIIEHGKVRPCEEEGHEHFGFLDGVSQPALKGLVKPHTGQLECEPGAIIMGLKGDDDLSFPQGRPPVATPRTRPSWAIGGSVMAFRKLHQRVPEFDKFLEENPIKEPGLSHEQGVALRGAKMVGRWKSGVPIDLSDKDDPKYLDPEVINNFHYHDPTPGQDRCPFSAHIRKTAPREHHDAPGARIPLAPVLPRALIMRAGIPYGPEVTPAEREAQKTSEEKDRGLLFVSYQSHLGSFGFSFIQKRWANNPAFPPLEENSFDDGVDTGFDPIIGNAKGVVRTRLASGTNPSLSTEEIKMEEDFVIAKGGEYFFIPPLTTIDRIGNGDKLRANEATAPSASGGGAPAAAPSA
ncbi:hypothetical protein M407DRAFT_22166 [Tulasnella calospora MUT 4182]|uniref:DyP dimeric alpha+beta barrel domain-containing protein n=1 Tax=Tulasnella calospora MUT 4182 TaxID=1051891 RepID=A0A0C3QD11_9AGAM|nr:hypothetical protein M407DRAFT_22166 [Tulasnella calospora MUT 4182]